MRCATRDAADHPANGGAMDIMIKIFAVIGFTAVIASVASMAAFYFAPPDARGDHSQRP